MIKHARMMKKLTQEQLAERIEVSTSKIINYENGKEMPETLEMFLLCRELDLLPEEIISGSRYHNEEARKELLSQLLPDSGDDV